MLSLYFNFLILEKEYLYLPSPTTGINKVFLILNRTLINVSQVVNLID